MMASLIAASGPIAFATSFAPCAKLKSAAAKIRGIVKRELTPPLVCSTLSAERIIIGFTTKKITTAEKVPIARAVKKFTLIRWFTPFKIR